MATIVGAENEQQRQEREAKEKADADAGGGAIPPPPSLITEQSFLQYMHMVEETRRRDQENQNKFMQDIASRVGGAPRDNGARGVSLSTFQDARPLPFATAVHPMEAEDWLKDTERKLRAVGCTEEEKVRYVVHLLAGPAASWWENTVAIYPPEKVFTWEEFKEKFREHHVPESIMELKHREFEDLKQNNNPIMKYINDFTDLSRYVVDDVNTEEKRKKRFLRGLHPYVKMQLRPAATQTFQQLVNAAITFEDDYKQV